MEGVAGVGGVGGAGQGAATNQLSNAQQAAAEEQLFTEVLVGMVIPSAIGIGSQIHQQQKSALQETIAEGG